MAYEEEFLLKGKIQLEGGEEVAQKAADVAEKTAEKVQEVERKVKQKANDKPPADETSEIAKSLSANLQNFQKNRFVSQFGSLISSPSGAFSTSDLSNIGAQGLASQIPVIAGALAGPLGTVVAQAMTGPLNLFIDKFFAQRKQVESAAGQAVQSRVQSFAAQGIEISDEEISIALDQERKRSARVLEAMKQVGKVQDLTNDSIEGMFSSLYRRTLDSLVG